MPKRTEPRKSVHKMQRDVNSSKFNSGFENLLVSHQNINCCQNAKNSSLLFTSKNSI